MADLPPDMRLKLINFITIFAWADFDIQEEEKSFVLDLVSRFELDDEDRKKVEKWLESPPEMSEVEDPADIPEEYREQFLQECLKLIAADKRIDPEEVDVMKTFRGILFPSED